MAPSGHISGQFHVYSINYSKVTLSTCSEISSGPECCRDQKGWHDGRMHLCVPLYSGAKFLPLCYKLPWSSPEPNSPAPFSAYLPQVASLFFFFLFWSVAYFVGFAQSSLVTWMKQEGQLRWVKCSGLCQTCAWIEPWKRVEGFYFA